MSDAPRPRKAQVIMAPRYPKMQLRYSIFLAGTTSNTGERDWREALVESLEDLSVTFYNPKRDDWDSTWREDFSDNRWIEQVRWELDMQAKADLVVVYLHGVSLAPISMLELGLWARDKKVVAYAAQDYSKRGNVQAVCARFDSEFADTEEDLIEKVRRRVKEYHEDLLGTSDEHLEDSDN